MNIICIHSISWSCQKGTTYHMRPFKILVFSKVGFKFLSKPKKPKFLNCHIVYHILCMLQYYIWDACMYSIKQKYYTGKKISTDLHSTFSFMSLKGRARYGFTAKLAFLKKLFLLSRGVTWQFDVNIFKKKSIVIHFSLPAFPNFPRQCKCCIWRVTLYKESIVVPQDYHDRL